jgi:hypothetical protein
MLGRVTSRRPATFNGLRHTHASQLIANDVDIVTISNASGTQSRASPLRSMPTCLQGTTVGRGGNQRGPQHSAQRVAFRKQRSLLFSENAA